MSWINEINKVVGCMNGVILDHSHVYRNITHLNLYSTEHSIHTSNSVFLENGGISLIVESFVWCCLVDI